jgi:hypothetical protein
MAPGFDPRAAVCLDRYRAQRATRSGQQGNVKRDRAGFRTRGRSSPFLGASALRRRWSDCATTQVYRAAPAIFGQTSAVLEGPLAVSSK